MEHWCLCGECFQDGDSTSVLTQKAVNGIVRVRSSIDAKVGDRVHQKCRRDLVRPQYVERNLSPRADVSPETTGTSRRSKTPSLTQKIMVCFVARRKNIMAKREVLTPCL